MNPLLLALWLSTGLVHLVVPIIYYIGMKRVSLRQDGYGLKLDPAYRPTVSILVPAYNEEPVIGKKVQNIASINYPAEKLEVIVIDGGSTDATFDSAKEVLKKTGLRGTVVAEGGRRGKAAGLNQGLKLARGELVCISDAECEWDTNALGNATKYLSDLSVGSVSGIHEIQNPHETLSTNVENSYRSVYRVLRIGESKIHSTPIAEGELQVFRRNDLDEFDTGIGGDDTDAALCMVRRGLRSISAQDAVFYEPTPRTWRGRFRQKIRRGQHVLQAFVKHRNMLFTGKYPFSGLIFPMEFFLYIINPILFIPFAILTVFVLVDVPFLALASLLGFGAAALFGSLRRAAITYLTSNLTMLGAVLQEARGAKQLQWTKIDETRQQQTHGPKEKTYQTISTIQQHTIYKSE